MQCASSARERFLSQPLLSRPSVIVTHLPVVTLCSVTCTMRILVVEDEPALQQQVRAGIEAQGYTVDATGEGKEALYLATEYPYDAAIVDLGLPGLSGLDIIARLRKQRQPACRSSSSPRAIAGRTRCKGWRPAPTTT